MTTHQESPELYGLIAEFASPEQLLTAIGQARDQRYRSLDAYSPFPVEGLSEALGFTRNRVPLLVLLGGLAGALGGYGLQYYSAVIDYPINVGGRPVDSWQAFLPATAELLILGAALTGVIGTLILCGLPRFYHPVFNIPEFARASRDRFFLVIRADDPAFKPIATRRFLAGLEPLLVADIEH